MKTIQYFTDEYLRESSKLSTTEIARFLDDFQHMHQPADRSILISMKVPERLLRAFRKKCEIEAIPYQTQIKKLMLDWV
jgi:predicted DNA binding CopG/RHH family protein